MKKALPKKFYKKMVKPEAEPVVLPVPEKQFPKISLTIPESVTLQRIFSRRVFIFNFLCGFLLMAIAIVGFDINGNMQALGAVVQERQSLEQQVEQLNAMLVTHKNYRDGLYQLAVLEQTLGRNQAAYEHIMAALELDPDFIDGRVFLEELVD